MRVLAVDIGTGTQDVLYFDSQLHVENSYKIVAPSPTMVCRRRIQQATQAGRPLALYGTIMGGGPVSWAIMDHLNLGLEVYSTPSAAATIDDDLDRVAELGIKITSPKHIARADNAVLVELGDFNLDVFSNAFAQFGLELQPDVLAIAVFDHGNSPPGYSDRQFRFDYLTRNLQSNPQLYVLAHQADQVPADMTRMQAVAQAALATGIPTMIMDTAPAAICGALLDPVVSQREHLVAVNVGNLHTLAFQLGPKGIEGLFEHHTGELTCSQLDGFLRLLIDRDLTHEMVFDSQGHGSLLLERDEPIQRDPMVTVTGPRRSLMDSSVFEPHMAAPFGDMMLAGCYGMLSVLPHVFPQHASEIPKTLSQSGAKAPWELG
ncbi:MAG: DUF1786 domain-containing protein [Chloroflexota bacterium]